jgi:Uma2 family endonuclease
MPSTKPAHDAPPALESGDHLERDEFERRYEARNDDHKVELIGGVVFVASPVRRPHSSHRSLLGGWLERYAEVTPNVDPLQDTSVRLGPLDEPQPDLVLRLARGGSSVVDPEQYVSGPVELVIEVAHSSVALDLHEKKACYERHGCREYLVVLVAEQEVLWFERDGGRYAPLPAHADGTLRSRVFPGLWLDPRALFAADRPALAATHRRGLASPEHAAFVDGPGRLEPPE